MEHLTVPTTFVVLDRHALFARGVVGLLRDAHPGWDCAHVASLAELRNRLAATTPVLALIDLDHPELRAPQAFATLAAAHPQHLLVGLADHEDRLAMLRCLADGARGYLPRHTDPVRFVRAIEVIADGAILAPAPRTGAALVTQATGPGTLPALTDRQRDVLHLLAEGCPTKLIARRLNLAVGTVKVHLAAIYRALGASSRLEAIAKVNRLTAA